ncbi:hypothetical protein EDD86DRAFT_246928 [Gorgonomyces haynaldii]|nr:hypothetical protein EDD86DRAFT_246928 [Gorgonomyces haynaldii]
MPMDSKFLETFSINEPIIRYFRCAVARPFLKDGTLYTLKLAKKDIVSIAKASWAGIIANAILITTAETKYFIGSIYNRDEKFEFLVKWQEGSTLALPMQQFNSSSVSLSELDTPVPEFDTAGLNVLMDNDFATTMETLFQNLDWVPTSFLGTYLTQRLKVKQVRTKYWSSLGSDEWTTIDQLKFGREPVVGDSRTDEYEQEIPHGIIGLPESVYRMCRHMVHSVTPNFLAWEMITTTPALGVADTVRFQLFRTAPNTTRLAIHDRLLTFMNERMVRFFEDLENFIREQLTNLDPPTFTIEGINTPCRVVSAESISMQDFHQIAAQDVPFSVSALWDMWYTSPPEGSPFIQYLKTEPKFKVPKTSSVCNKQKIIVHTPDRLTVEEISDTPMFGVQNHMYIEMTPNGTDTHVDVRVKVTITGKLIPQQLGESMAVNEMKKVFGNWLQSLVSDTPRPPTPIAKQVPKLKEMPLHLLYVFLILLVLVLTINVYTLHYFIRTIHKSQIEFLDVIQTIKRS